MLDEIINYVQSLQQQVEVRMPLTYLIAPCSWSLKFLNFFRCLQFQFLSMKLATVNPQLDFSNLSTLLHKDVSL
jgi:hypothetical protein